MKSIILTTIKKMTKVFEWLSPGLAGWWVSRLFFSPSTTRRTAPDIKQLRQDSLSFETMEGTQSQCQVYSAGSGPAVLLVHGWEGSAYSLSAISRALLDQGLRIILFDMPSHGLSQGKKTNLVEISHIIQQIAREYGPLKAIVGHSFGSVAAGFAIKSGLSVEQFISISAPSRMDFIIDRFCEIVGASRISKKALISKIESILEGSYEQASLTSMALELPGIIIHDLNDRVVPYELAVDLSNAWPNARLFTTERLGHNRILRNREVIDSVVDAIAGTHAGRSATDALSELMVARNPG